MATVIPIETDDKQDAQHQRQTHKHADPRSRGGLGAALHWCGQSELEFRLFEAMSCLAFGYDFGLKNKPMLIAKWGYRIFLAYFCVVEPFYLTIGVGLSWRIAPLDPEMLANNSMKNDRLGMPLRENLGGAPARINKRPLSMLEFLTVLQCILFGLATVVTCFFMMYWTDSSLKYLRAQFALFKSRSLRSFMAFFWIYVIGGTILWLSITGFINIPSALKVDDTDQAFYNAEKEAMNGTEPDSHHCCTIRNAWAYMYPTGDFVSGIGFMRARTILWIIIAVLQTTWCSATWVWIMFMLASEFTHHVSILTWRKINSGQALQEYLYIFDKVTHISKQWDIKNSFVMVAQMGSSVTAVTSVAFSFNNKDGGALNSVARLAMALIPVINLFVNLLAAGYVTDTLSRSWLLKLKQLELDNVFLRGLGDNLNDADRLSLNARACQYHMDTKKTQEFTDLSNDLSVGVVDTKDSFTDASGLVIANGALGKHKMQDMDAIRTDTHVAMANTNKQTRTNADLEMLKSNIRTYKEQAAITVCGCFTISMGSVISIFLQLFAFVTLIIGEFVLIEE